MFNILYFPATLVTPSPKKGPRSTQKQDSFKKKLIRRRDLSESKECEICGGAVGDLEAAHIVDHQFAERLNDAYMENKKLPISVNDASNGLMLCANCHSKYDKQLKGGKGRSMQIKADGTILLYGEAKKDNYNNLQGKKVPWHSQIDVNKDYPSSVLLKFAIELKTVSTKKRLFELQEDSEESDEETARRPVKQRKKPSKATPLVKRVVSGKKK